MKRRIVVFGPGPRFKGGLANYTTSLAKAFDRQPDTEVYLFSWTQQYPAIIPRDFIDRKSKTDQLQGTNIKVRYITNYNNPLSWRATVNEIAELNADIVVFQWSVAVQGLPLGYIARKLRKIKGLEVVFDLHFVIQKEQSALDMAFSRYGISAAHSYVVHALKTANELETLLPNRRFKITENGKRAADGASTVIKLYHPVYDMFKPDPAFDIEAEKQRLNLRKHVFLFFGFIRKYKGLHFCLEAFAKMAKDRDDVSLLVVGESFWQTLDKTKLSTRIKSSLFGLAKSIFLKKTDNEQDYNPLAMIDQLGIKDKVTVVNDFVPNEEVHRYFQVSDYILLFYEYATPSGVESMAYNFNLPVLATSVGHFPETIRHGVNGYLAEGANTVSMAQVMQQAIDQPIDRAQVAAAAAGFSWDNYAATILHLPEPKAASAS